MGMTGESLSPRTSKPIFLSSDLKKLLFSRMLASFWAPSTHHKEKKKNYSIEHYSETHLLMKNSFSTSVGAILPKDNFNSRDNLLRCWRRHGSSIQMSRATLLQALNYLLKVIARRTIRQSSRQSNQVLQF
jgi:hypothetical protein